MFCVAGDSAFLDSYQHVVYPDPKKYSKLAHILHNLLTLQCIRDCQVKIDHIDTGEIQLGYTIGAVKFYNAGKLLSWFLNISKSCLLHCVTTTMSRLWLCNI